MKNSKYGKQYRVLILIFLLESVLLSVIREQFNYIAPLIECLVVLVAFVPIWLLCFLASKDEQIHVIIQSISKFLIWFIPVCVIAAGTVEFFGIKL